MTMKNKRLAGGAVISGLVLACVIVQAQTGDNPDKANKVLDERVAERFRTLDKDRDDRLTQAELGAGLFEQLNVDGDQYVTLPEAQAEIRKRGFEAVLKAAQTKRGVDLPKAESPVAKETERPSKQNQPEPALRQGPRRLIPGDQGVGRMIADLSMTDINGKTIRLSDFADRSAVVIAFTNTTCPICKKYAPSLATIERQFADRKVAFIYVNPTASEKPASLQSAVATHGFAGPYIRDTDSTVARAVGATHTTDVFVLDSRRTVVYRGAVDDQYGLEYSLDAPRTEYLKLAIGAAIDRRPLLVGATQAPGCPLDLEETKATPTEITFHNRISRILQSRCLECHREGGAGPFPLDTYENVIAQSGAIRQAVERGVMPPWFAARPENGQPSHWANDKSISDQEKSDLLNWLAKGKPAGNAEDAPLARQFPEGWRIGQPEHLIQLPAPMTVKATGIMPYQNIIVESGLTEDKWVRAMEIRPTAPEVVHHVLVFLLPPRGTTAGDRNAGDDESGGFFVAYAPGHDALVFPDGYGKKIPAGSRFKFQMHFTPNGTATEDQTRLGFIFSSQEPTHLVSVTGIANPKLAIPPGADNHAVTATQKVQADSTILAFFPHMHLRGKAFRYEAIYPDGHSELLLDVPHYDFNWQMSYRLAEPLELPKGTTLQLTGWFDNSKNNPANPDPTKTVRWGPQTFDEMMLGYVEYYTTGPADPSITNSLNMPNLEVLFKQLDRNQDGKLSGDEFPADWKERLLKLDSDGDNAVTLDEIQKGIRRRRQREN